MRHIIILSLLFISSIASAQLVRIDSTTTAKRIYYYNQAGLYIGSDSVNEKVVRATLDGGDTFKIPTYTLIQRDPEKFYTIDSLAPYLKITDLDEKVEDKIGDKLLVSGGSKSYNDATGETTITITGSGLTGEQARDSINEMLRAGSDITITKSDSGDSTLIQSNLNALTSRLQRTRMGANYGWVMCYGGGLTEVGMDLAFTGVGNTANMATTTAYTARDKFEYLVTTPSTTAVVGFKGQYDLFWAGNNAYNGGFDYAVTWGPATGVSTTTHRAFAGVRNSSGNPSDIDPSTLVNCIGMGYDDDDTNIQIMHNDASGTCTKIDLGSGFPVPTADRTKVFTFYLSIESGSGTYYWKVVDEADNKTATGTITTDIPTSTTLLRPYGHVSVGGTSSEIGMGIFNIQKQTHNN